MAAELAALIRACKAEPDDDAPRLILADWLEEHGDEQRAEFVRRQVRYPGLTEAECPYNPGWLGEWKHFGDENRTLRRATPVGYEFGFHRGFIRVSDYYRELYDRLDEILSPPYVWTWLEEIKFGSWHDGDWTPLFRSSCLLELTRLEFIDDGYRSVLLEPLLTCPFLTTLRHLRLVMVTMDDDGLARLSDCRNLAGLRSFDLTEMYLGPPAAYSLAASELWDQLRCCRIVGSRIGDEGLAALAHGRLRPRLERLDLTIGDYSDQGLVELARSNRFPALRELAVGYRTVLEHGGRFGGEGVNAVLTSPTFSGVRIVVSIVSEEPVPADLGDLCARDSLRLEVRYRNPRQSPKFERWFPTELVRGSGSA